MNKFILIILLALSFISPLQAKELHIYQDPIPLGNYVTDYDAMLTEALSRVHWRFERVGDKRFAWLNYKAYEIKVELVENDKGISIVLLDSKRDESCIKKCKVDMEQVTAWLVRLRRTIAYDLTLIVRDDALRNTML